jgi:hypothetical protein
VIRLWLLGEISKQFFAAIDLAVVIAVDGEKCISRGLRRPCDVDGMTVSPNVKDYPCLGGSQVKGFVRSVNNDWRAGAAVASNIHTLATVPLIAGWH